MKDTVKNNLIRKFSVSKASLSNDERLVLGKLEKAAELIAPIYEMQINDKYPGANFYPYDVSKEEILKAAEEDPLILSPYTVVEKTSEGLFKAVPFHIKYATELKPVIKLIREAAVLTKNREFAKRLDVQADALENGSYEAADIYWLTMKPYKIDITIGPVERYEDRLFFKKTCYSATVGILDIPETKKAEDIRDALFSSHRRSFTLAQRVEFMDRLQVRIDQVSVLAGLDARALFSLAFLPVDSRLIEKYGVEVIVFETAAKQNLIDLYYPIFKNLFEPTFQKSYSSELLFEGLMRLFLVRGISTSLVKYHDAQKRLGDYYPVLNEMASHVLAVKNAGTLLIKDVISQKQLEAMMIMLLCRAFASFINSRNVKSLIHHSQGYAITVNYFLENGVLREYNGISWVNFTKMFVALSDLAAILEKILAFGDAEDARRLVEQYGSIERILELTPQL